MEKFNSSSIRCVKNIKSLQSRSSLDQHFGLSGLLGRVSSPVLFGLNEGEEDADFGRYIVFDGQKCRISGKERNPVKIQHRYQTAERIHTIIHEFIHHYFHYHEGINTSKHGRRFRQMEKKMNAQYGIFFFYAWNNYAKYFHNFWGFPFGKKETKCS